VFIIFLCILKTIKIVRGCIRFIEIRGADGLVVVGWMVFCKVIRLVDLARRPVYVELLLSDAVTNPVKSHINSFGVFLLDGVVGKSITCTVVNFDGCWWLRMVQLN